LELRRGFKVCDEIKQNARHIDNEIMQTARIDAGEPFATSRLQLRIA
jgi:hypothetical protein